MLVTFTKVNFLLIFCVDGQVISKSHSSASSLAILMPLINLFICLLIYVYLICLFKCLFNLFMTGLVSLVRNSGAILSKSGKSRLSAAFLMLLGKHSFCHCLHNIV